MRIVFGDNAKAHVVSTVESFQRRRRKLLNEAGPDVKTKVYGSMTEAFGSRKLATMREVLGY